MAFLQKPLVWVLDGKAYSLGSPSDSDIDQSFDHMKSWIKLAREEVRAEFPDFEIAQAFSIFCTSGAIAQSHLNEFDKRCKRLSLFSGVDAEYLKQQILRIRPLAILEARSKLKSDQEAW
eukprot:9480984-Pyramimonas_sp.AAC.1